MEYSDFSQLMIKIRIDWQQKLPISGFRPSSAELSHIKLKVYIKMQDNKLLHLDLIIKLHLDAYSSIV